MEAYARAPDPLTKTDDMASNWHSWKEDFIIFMKVTGYINKPNEIRANLLKNRIGKIGIDAIQTISFDNPEDKDDMDILIAKLEEFFNPPKNEVVERYQFFTRDKKQNETIEEYINILKEKAKTCNFNEMTDSIIRDKIILITQDKILRKKFFEINNLDLQKLVAIYNDYNMNMEKMKQITKESTESISPIQKPPCIEATANNNTKKKCWRCNCPHPLGKCPAWGSKCTKCGDINHFTQCCKGKSNLKSNDTKMNNLLNPMQQANLMQKTGASKSNNNGNNQKNFKAKDLDSMNKMTSFPDIPTASCDAATSSNDTSDFVMLDAYKPSPSLPFDNTKIRPGSFYCPKNTQYNDVKGPKLTKPSYANVSQTSNNFQNHVISSTHRAYTSQRTQFKHDQKKKLDQDTCVLS